MRKMRSPTCVTFGFVDDGEIIGTPARGRWARPRASATTRPRRAARRPVLVDELLRRGRGLFGLALVVLDHEAHRQAADLAARLLHPVGERDFDAALGGLAERRVVAVIEP